LPVSLRARARCACCVVRGGGSESGGEWCWLTTTKEAEKHTPQTFLPLLTRLLAPSFPLSPSAGTWPTLPSCLEVTCTTNNGGKLDGGIIQGVRHRTLVVEGVQFHPESILTEHGHDMLRNFLKWDKAVR
jgi:hypothetical protein